MIALIFVLSLAHANDDRPSWADRASFVRDSRLYVVGSATNKQTVEEARLAAALAAETEANIHNGAKVVSMETLVMHETGKPGAYNCYRLMSAKTENPEEAKAEDTPRQGLHMISASFGLSVKGKAYAGLRYAYNTEFFVARAEGGVYNLTIPEVRAGAGFGWQGLYLGVDGGYRDAPLVSGFLSYDYLPKKGGLSFGGEFRADRTTKDNQFMGLVRASWAW